MNVKTPFFALAALFMGANAAQGQTLEDYLQIAAQNNPEIQAFELNHRLALEKVEESSSLPNLDLGFGYFARETETRTGAQTARFAVTQMLPWFGTLSARQRYASSLAENEFVEFSIAKRKLALTVAQAYYTLYSLQAKARIIDDQIDWVMVNQERLLTSIEASRSSLSEMLKLEVRLNDLQQKKRSIAHQLTAERSAFNNLMNREAQAELIVVDSLPLPKIQLPELVDFSANPELLKFDKLFASVTQAEVLNQKERLPNLAVGVDFLTVEPRPDLVFDDNGKDILMPRVSLSIPVFSKKYSSVSVQNKLKQERLDLQKQQRLNILEDSYSRALARLKEAQLSYELQSESLMRLKQTEVLFLTKFSTNSLGFEELVELQDLQLNLQLRRIDATVQCYTQYALINYLINP